MRLSRRKLCFCSCGIVRKRQHPQASIEASLRCDFREVEFAPVHQNGPGRVDFVRGAIQKRYVGATPCRGKRLNDDGPFESVADYWRKLRAGEIGKKEWKLRAG